MQARNCVVRIFPILAVLAVLLIADSLFAQSARRIIPPLDTGSAAPYTGPNECARCHPRQFRETAQAVHSGYRNFSPTFNTLEISTNYVIQLANVLIGVPYGSTGGGSIVNGQVVPPGVINPDDPFYDNLPLAGAFDPLGGNIGFPTNARPVYSGTNYIDNRSDDPNFNNHRLRAGLCIGCHGGHGFGLGLNPGEFGLSENDPRLARDIPEWQGQFSPNENGQLVVTGPGSRPLRDYHFRDEQGNQVLPATIGGPRPAGASTSLMGYGIHCDYCHNVVGPDMERSLQGDGFSNTSLRLLYSDFKVGPFINAFPPQDDFHQSTNRAARINYLRSPMLCNGCHDVRIPTGDIVTHDSYARSGAVHFRLENLSTEWTIGAYNDPSKNPFNQVVRCQDCHTSLYPYAGNTTYDVVDPLTGDLMRVTSPTPAIFPMNFAAEGEAGVANGHFGTRANVPLPRRKVITHYFTGIDVPLLYDSEMKDFIGTIQAVPGESSFAAANRDYYTVADRLLPAGQGRISEPQPDNVFANFGPDQKDEYGIPLNIRTRRDDLAKAAVRIDLAKSDSTTALGETYTARVRAVALTGHRLPAGFSQERGVWIQFTVSAERKDGEGEFVLYQSGYLVDKPHIDTDEMQADGNFHDEDQEHIEAVVNPFTHDNEVFILGPDNGPEARIFEGAREGLVFFRNELVRIYGPAQLAGRATGVPGINRRHPRTFALLEDHLLEEETFSAGLTSFVDNWRSLPPLYPRTYLYEVHLPSAHELEELGIEVEGPLKVRAQVHFQHFPPLFLRFLARVGGAYVEKNLHDNFSLSLFTGLRGPSNRNLNMWNEQRIDDLLRIVYDIADAEIEVPLSE